MRISVAAFPKKREIALKLMKELFSKKYKLYRLSIIINNWRAGYGASERNYCEAKPNGKIKYDPIK